MLQVEYAKTYLLQIVNAVMNAEPFLAIADHNLTVLAQHVSYLKPFHTTCLLLGPGQTMDVLVTSNQSPGQYYMVGRQFYTDKAIFTGYDKVNVSAILENKGDYTPQAAPNFPTTTLPAYTDYAAGINFRNQLRSPTPQDVPKNTTTRMFVVAAQNELLFSNSRDVITSLAASLNKVDVLQAYYNNISGFYEEDFPDMPPTMYDYVADDLPVNTTSSLIATKVKVLEYGEEVEIVFQSSNVLNAAEDHLMHLHGHSFYMVGAGGGIFDFNEDPKTYNLVDPPSINNATLPKNGWVAVRFKALNRGVWLWQCHLERHYTWGMNTVLVVKNGGTPETTMRGPPAYMPPCDDSTTIRFFKSHFPSSAASLQGR